MSEIKEAETGGNLFNNEFEFLEKIKPIIISEVEKKELVRLNMYQFFYKFNYLWEGKDFTSPIVFDNPFGLLFSDCKTVASHSFS